MRSFAYLLVVDISVQNAQNAKALSGGGIGPAECRLQIAASTIPG